MISIVADAEFAGADHFAGHGREGRAGGAEDVGPPEPGHRRPRGHHAEDAQSSGAAKWQPQSQPAWPYSFPSEIQNYVLESAHPASRRERDFQEFLPL